MGQVLNTVHLCNFADTENKEVMAEALNPLAACSDAVYPQEIVVEVDEHFCSSYPRFTHSFDPNREIKSRSRQTALQVLGTFLED